MLCLSEHVSYRNAETYDIDQILYFLLDGDIIFTRPRRHGLYSTGYILDTELIKITDEL